MKMTTLNWRGINAFVFILTLLYISCRITEDESHLVSEEMNSVAKAEKTIENNSRIDTYDGLYLNTFNASGLLLIHDSKIHHFNRNDSKFIYKDEEYDFDEIEDNSIRIIRTYRLDRKEEVVAKETLLKDISLNCKDTEHCDLIRNGRTFKHIPDLKNLLKSIGGEDLINYCINELSEEYTSEQIDQALNSESFLTLTGLHKRQLRDGDIYFKSIVEAVLKRQGS